MKIVCDACAAKYSIADEKVAGKVFKIRCKKCSNVIVVRGNADAEGGAPEQLEQKETRVFDYSGYDNPQDAVAAAESSIGDGAVWHIVVDQEQVGPLSPEEVRSHFARGDIDGESFIWREGFADWERVDSLAEFADLAARGNVDDAAAAMFGGPALDDGAGAADPADLFTAQSAEPMIAPAADAGLFGGAADDGGLFGGAAAASPEPAMSAMSASAAEDKLKGQRNENSVLFSLNNLASLASDAPRAAAPSSSMSASSSSSSSVGMAQAGGQEGSGLIDIRAMASMYVGNNDRAGGAPAASIDDLPVFSQPAITSASPVLMPVATPANNNKLLVALIAGIGALVLVAVLLVVLVLKGGDDKVATTAANNAKATGDDTGETGTKSEATGEGEGDGDGDGDGDADKAGGGRDMAAVEAKKAQDEKKAAEEAKRAEIEAKREAEKTEREERLKNETPSQRRAREKREKKAEDAREKKREDAKRREEARKEKAEATKPDTSSKGGCDELDCLVNPNKSCCKKGKSDNDKKKTDSSLPERPAKSSLSSGMNKARGSAKSCASKANFSGAVKIKVRVSGSGGVSSASGSGGPGGVNSCVASAVKRNAKFPKSQNGISFSFTFRF